MAITPNTVSFFSAPYTATVTSGTLTAVTMPTITLPESSKTFESVVAYFTWTDLATAATTVTGRRIDFGLNGGAKTTYSNTRAMTNSGENYAGLISFDLTAQFTAQWSGTSMTCQVDASVTGPSTTNFSIEIRITYRRDDTSATQVKTIGIPLNAPVGALGTTKPASLDTIPALDTFLTEGGKTILGTWIQLEFITGSAAGTVDQTLSMEVSSLGVHNPNFIEMALATCMNIRYVWNPSFSTAVTQTWHLWTTTASYIFHPKVILWVTYTFDASAANDVMHSLFLPLELTSPMGDSSTRPTRGSRDVWVGEASPTLLRCAAYVWWQTTGPLSGLNLKLGTGSYVTYTDGGSVYAGSAPLMIRNDSAISSFGQGRSAVELSCYCSNGATNVGNLNAMIHVVYSAPKMSGGHGAHSRTVWRIVRDIHDGNTALASSTTRVVDGVNAQRAAVGSLPSEYFLSAVGLMGHIIPPGGANLGAYQVAVQKDSGEGWDALYTDIGCSDAEMGTVVVAAQAREFFKRWTGDPGPGRNDILTVRRWKMTNATVNAAAQAIAHDLFTFVTFHGHAVTVSGTIFGSSGGTVTISLHRASTAEKVLETTTAGDGAFSFTWYDTTEALFVLARDGSNTARRAVSETFNAPNTSLKLRLLNPRVIDAHVVRKAG